MEKLIVQYPAILGGKPVIKGTRMSVEAILELLASGMEIDEVLKEYPFLNKNHIQAAIDFAAKVVSREEKYIFDTAKCPKVLCWRNKNFLPGLLKSYD